jgi:hypothetical protein
MIAPITSRPPLPLMLLVLTCATGVLVLGSYWLANHPQLPALAATESTARLFAALAPADHSYFDAVGQQQVGLVGTTLVIGTALYAGLFVAWLRNSAVALPLALAAGSIGCYAAVINGWIALIEGFPNTDRTSAAAALLFGLSAGWFAIHLGLIADAVRRIARALQVAQYLAPDVGGGRP